MIDLPIGLVACSKTKLSVSAPARELYTGTLFKLSVQWLESRCSSWAVLSAKHGVLLPDQIVEPYEQTLVGAPWGEVQAWHHRTKLQLVKIFPGCRFRVIAGHEYLGALTGLDFEQEFSGLPIGRKMQSLKAGIATAEVR